MGCAIPTRQMQVGRCKTPLVVWTEVLRPLVLEGFEAGFQQGSISQEGVGAAGRVLGQQRKQVTPWVSFHPCFSVVSEAREKRPKVAQGTK